jgi:hypothetical protein
MLTGSHQYLLHFKVKALPSEQPATFLYLSRQNFEEALMRVNNYSKLRFVEYLSELPPFKDISKVIRKKVIQ